MKLLILNQYFLPDQAATAQLLGQLAAHLTQNHEVHVVCGTPTYDPDPTLKPHPKIVVHRVPLFGQNRSSLFFRLLNYVLFLGGAFWKTFSLPKYDVIMAWSDPPIIGVVAGWLRKFKGSKFLFVSQDVYPEIAIAAGRMNNWLSLSILKKASAFILRSADHVVVVGHDMRERLIQKGVPGNRLSVIPNWQDLESLRPGLGADFRKSHGIAEEDLLIMHSGNIGVSQDFDTLLEAADQTKEEEHIRFLIIGNGNRKEYLKQEIQKRNLHNIRLLPYQPKGMLAESLGSADLHYVSLLPAFDGYIVPSKIYGVLAVGRPVLVNMSESNDVAKIVQEAGCGMVCGPHVNRLVDFLRDAVHKRDELKRLGENGRTWIEQNGGHEHAFESYETVLKEISS